MIKSTVAAPDRKLIGPKFYGKHYMRNVANHPNQTNAMEVEHAEDQTDRNSAPARVRKRVTTGTVVRLTGRNSSYAYGDKHK